MMRTRYCWLLFATYCVLARTTCGVLVLVPWSMVLSLVVVSWIYIAAGGAGGGIIGVDGGRRGRTVVVVVRVID